jgi:RNA 2',3'-cyclic 3'-phosphodiesterase
LEAIPRAFLGCRIPDEIAMALAERVASVRETIDTAALRWVHRERLHATLRFLGRVASADRTAISAVVEPIARVTSPIDCRFAAAIALPSWRRAQVVAVTLESHECLESLARSIEAALREPFGVADKAFRAHVTIVRVSRARPGAVARARALLGALSLDVGPFRLDEISLFRSDTTRDGPRYTAVERFPFLGV